MLEGRGGHGTQRVEQCSNLTRQQTCISSAGTPDKPGTPTVTSKRDELEFSFQCPTIWNLRRFQFVLKRKDQDRDVTVLSPSGTGTSQSPDLVSSLFF